MSIKIGSLCGVELRTEKTPPAVIDNTIVKLVIGYLDMNLLSGPRIGSITRRDRGNVIKVL